MKKMVFKKKKLLEAIKGNRDQHQHVFEEALLGYKEKIIEVLEENLEDARTGVMIDETIYLQRPVNHTRDYDRVLMMLEMSDDETHELSEQEFAQYVMDDWSWKRQFLMTNSAYSLSAAQDLNEEDTGWTQT